MQVFWRLFMLKNILFSQTTRSQGLKNENKLKKKSDNKPKIQNTVDYEEFKQNYFFILFKMQPENIAISYSDFYNYSLYESKCNPIKFRQSINIDKMANRRKQKYRILKWNVLLLCLILILI